MKFDARACKNPPYLQARPSNLKTSKKHFWSFLSLMLGPVKTPPIYRPDHQTQKYAACRYHCVGSHMGHFHFLMLGPVKTPSIYRPKHQVEIFFFWFSPFALFDARACKNPPYLQARASNEHYAACRLSSTYRPPLFTVLQKIFLQSPRSSFVVLITWPLWTKAYMCAT